MMPVPKAGLLAVLALLAASLGAPRTVTAAEIGARAREVVRGNGVTIEVITEGQGPAIVLLPSRGRDSEDFDEVAAGLAAAGYLVLRPQPRGALGSTGPMAGVTLHDLASDVALVVEALGAGRAVLVGHAYGSWVARMTAADHPRLVRGVVVAATAAKSYPPGLSASVTASAEPTLTDAERLVHLRRVFFAPGSDPRMWLKGWHPAASRMQDDAGKATPQAAWWSGGTAPLLDLQADADPFRPENTRSQIRDEFGDKVTVALVPGASHALLPEQPTAVVAAITRWVADLP